MKYLETIEKETSVKSLGIIEKAGEKLGIADFTYRPVFSVFDYGTIEPPVELDNSTVCLMQGYNFEILKDEGLPTHYLGLVDEEGKTSSARDMIKRGIAPWTTRVRFGERRMPTFGDGQWDYSMFGDSGNYILPIEFISRNSLTDKVWKRIYDGEVTLEELGLPNDFKKGDSIPIDDQPILDYSTKFEPDDRYLRPEVTQKMLGISEDQFEFIKGLTRKASQIMTMYAAHRGFVREDGKVEFVREGDDFMFADSVCTWHEDRLKYGNIGISKQRIRDKIVQLNPEWYAEIQNCKKRAKKEGVEDFRTLMDPAIKYTSPSVDFFHAINRLFQAGTNQWINAKVYDPYPGRDDSLEDSLQRAIEDFERMK